MPMRIVYQAENIIDANLVKNAFEEAGIPSFVSGQYLTGAAGELPPLGLVNVTANLVWIYYKETLKFFVVKGLWFASL